MILSAIWYAYLEFPLHNLYLMFYVDLYLMIFTDKKYTEAIEFYSKAIDLAPTVATYYGNRSIAYLRTEAFGYALQDASKSLEVDKNYIKVGSSVTPY